MAELQTKGSDHRRRLLEGMAHAVAAKGYAATTIADVVREAGVSRRTFYEHFDGKPACLAALFEAASRGALRVLQSALDASQPWQAQVEQALGAYFRALAANPVLLRTLYVEILGLGADGLAARRRVNDALAGFMLSVVNRDTGRGPLSAVLADAVVGGINELVLQRIERNQVETLPELVGPAASLVRAVTGTLEAERC